MTWDELRELVRRRDLVTAESADGLALERRLAGGTQVQTLVRTRAHGRDWVMIGCPLFEHWRMPPSETLAHNARLVVGAIVLQGGSVVIRHLVSLASVPGEELEQIMDLLAGEAVRLRARAASVPLASASSNDVFTSYAM